MRDQERAETPARCGRTGSDAPSLRNLDLKRADVADAEGRLAEATRNGDIPAAMRIANTLIRMNPASAEHHYNKGLLCQHQSEIGLAVNEFMHAIWLEPDGPYSDYARNCLEDLDVHQLNQIAILANEDLIFRTKLTRDCEEAAMERGFALSPMGERLLREYCEDSLADSPAPARASRYH